MNGLLPEPASDELLAARARRGGAAATRALRRRLHGPLLRLALVLVDDPRLAVTLTRRAINEAMESPADVSPRTAAVTALQRLTVEQREQDGETTALTLDERMTLAVGLLCDLDDVDPATAARMLGLTVDEVRRLHDGDVDGARAVTCAGWWLVRRYDDLGTDERAAADAHLGLCRSCQDGREARLAARRRLRRAVPAVGAAGGGSSVWFSLTGGSVSVPAVGGAVAGLAVGGATMMGTLGLGGAGDPADLAPRDRSVVAAQAGSDRAPPDGATGPGAGTGAVPAGGSRAGTQGDGTAASDTNSAAGSGTGAGAASTASTASTGSSSGDGVGGAGSGSDGSGSGTGGSGGSGGGVLDDPLDTVTDPPTKDPIDPVDQVVDDTRDSLTKTVDDTRDTVTKTVDDTTGTVTRAVDDTTGTVTGTVDDTTDRLTAPLSDVSSTPQDTVDTTTDLVGGLSGG